LTKVAFAYGLPAPELAAAETADPALLRLGVLARGADAGRTGSGAWSAFVLACARTREC
jgi:hypothetical protein